MKKRRAIGRELESGFTLIELLVVLSIVGILVLTGFNVMSSVIPKQRLNAAGNDLVSRLRSARMLTVVHNRPVSFVVDIDANTYHTCLDTLPFGKCTDAGDDYLNLESGREGTQGQSTWDLHPTLDIYAADFGDSVYNAVTYLPPAGLPVNITAGGSFVNGTVCLEVEAGDEGDDFADRYEYRRVSVHPIVGKVTLWKNKKTIVAQPACDNTETDWEKVY